MDSDTGIIELTATLGLTRPSGHYDAHADFMGIGVTIKLFSIN